MSAESMSGPLAGKTVLVTGANSGIGLETAAEVAGMGARTVITARNKAKGTAALDAIKLRHPGCEIELMDLDLASLSNVRNFCREFDESHDRLDVLVNNAGLVQDKRSETEDGFETTFQVNHLGPFLLTNLLLDKVKASAPARIVNVASSAHRAGDLDFDDLQSADGYRGMRTYGRSKLCNILFSRELARRLEGTMVTSNALHPGTVRTGWGKEGDSRWLSIGVKIGGIFFLSPSKGAKTSVYLASSPDVEGRSGEYWVKCRAVKPSKAAQDDDAARRLWDVSSEMVGL